MSTLPAVPDLATRVAALEARIADLEADRETHSARWCANINVQEKLMDDIEKLEGQAAHTQHQIRALADRIGGAEANAVEALQAAVTAERERCAGITERIAAGPRHDPAYAAAQDIEEQIRGAK